MASAKQAAMLRTLTVSNGWAAITWAQPPTVPAIKSLATAQVPLGGSFSIASMAAMLRTEPLVQCCSELRTGKIGAEGR